LREALDDRAIMLEWAQPVACGEQRTGRGENAIGVCSGRDLCRRVQNHKPRSKANVT
jgi:hypothetical protein